MKVRIQPKRSHFNEAKATQVAARFIAMAGGRMNYMLLLKLMYILDRRALKRWGRAVSGAEYFSMKLGPVLSEVLNLITEPPDANSYWGKHISEPCNYVVGVSSEPGDLELSEAEEEGYGCSLQEIRTQ